MNTNQKNKSLSLSLIKLIVGAAQILAIGTFGILLFTFFGDSFIKDFEDKPIVNTSKSTPLNNSDDGDWDKVENGIHLSTGLIYADNFELVRGNCTACHSGKLVAQNRATREGWKQMIRWMQETQGLWDLGKNEPKILDYLATHYAPKEMGRRSNIDVAAIEWYILDLEDKVAKEH